MLNSNEIWKPVLGFEKQYEISNKGNIRNSRNKILKTYLQNAGYLAIKFSVNGKKHHKLVHRLIAENFITNLENKPYVNHKDGNKLNNSLENLEWCTNSENILHARSTGLNPYNDPTKGKKLGKTSDFHNVNWDKNREKWFACVRVKGKTLHARRFDSEIEAAKHVNFIIDTYQLDRPKNLIS